jgi:hypothetical protein
LARVGEGGLLTLIALARRRRRPVMVVKLLRVYGGCLGIERRRRTRQPAKSPGELANEL